MKSIEYTLTSPEAIQARVDAFRPSRAGGQAEALRARLGATHFGGRYALTEEPYLIEGLKALQAMGMRIAKLWLAGRPGATASGYGFNAQWPDTSQGIALADLARTPNFRAAFAMPFHTFVLEALSMQSADWRRGVEANAEYFAREEQEFFDLAKALLEDYRDRDVTFIVQNWEGDWVLRGLGVNWEADPEASVPADIDSKIEHMVRWFQARQRGVERARQAVPDSRARVAHAVEVNKIWDVKNRQTLMERGIPHLARDVVPRVQSDLVFYSAYDACFDVPSSLWQAIEVLRAAAPPSALYGENNVAIGEIGRPENEGNRTREQIEEFWDNVLGVSLAMDLPYVLHWELYCNEPKKALGNKKDIPRDRMMTAEELRGFWLLRPDGSDSWAGAFIRKALAP